MPQHHLLDPAKVVAMQRPGTDHDHEAGGFRYTPTATVAMHAIGSVVSFYFVRSCIEPAFAERLRTCIAAIAVEMV